MSAAKDIANKKKKWSMGEYNPTEEEQRAYLWGVEKNIRISPRATVQGSTGNQWYVEIFSNGKWTHSPEKFGPVEVWKQVYNYYIYYYERRKKV